MKKEGLGNFRFKVIEKMPNSTQAQRVEREIFHLSLQDQNNIYNISVPGLTPDNTGRPVSDDTKALLAKNNPRSIAIRISDTSINPWVINDFVSLNAASKSLLTSHKSLERPLATGKLYKTRYLIQRIDAS